MTLSGLPGNHFDNLGYSEPGEFAKPFSPHQWTAFWTASFGFRFCAAAAATCEKKLVVQIVAGHPMSTIFDNDSNIGGQYASFQRFDDGAIDSFCFFQLVFLLQNFPSLLDLFRVELKIDVR